MRGSMDRRGQNIYGTPRIAPNPKLERSDTARLKRLPVTFDAAQRAGIEKAVREVCGYRGFRLEAVNVRTNHVHVVVAAGCKPEGVMNAVKSYATRKLRELGLLSPNAKPWARQHALLMEAAPRRGGN
jgi:REP element-mobilizing transposase RayT